jgi:hypothetical protein
MAALTYLGGSISAPQWQKQRIWLAIAQRTWITAIAHLAGSYSAPQWQKCEVNALFFNSLRETILLFVVFKLHNFYSIHNNNIIATLPGLTNGNAQ